MDDKRVTHIVVVLKDGRVATLKPNPELGIELDAILAALTRVTTEAADAVQPDEHPDDFRPADAGLEGDVRHDGGTP